MLYKMLLSPSIYSKLYDLQPGWIAVTKQYIEHLSQVPPPTHPTPCKQIDYSFIQYWK